MKKTFFGKFLCVFLVILLLVGCQAQAPIGTPTGTQEQTVSDTIEKVRLLNGTPIEEFSIVYDKDEPDYNLRAAEHIQAEVLARTGYSLVIKEDDEQRSTHEIIVGESSRQISSVLEVDTQYTQFAILADEEKIALEGDYFVIAAAAYFFVETYIPDTYFDSSIPKQTMIHEPIQKEAKNFILLIGDGMGVNQTLLYDVFDVSAPGTPGYSDGEDLFYGYLFPNQGYSRTASRSGVTDSAAGGTALATGYKTVNGYIGKNESGKNVTSLTELAASMGMATAVMSTDSSTGATPASFSAHANSRNDASDIFSSQQTTMQTYGTLIHCDFNFYDVKSVKNIQNTVNETLNTLSKDEDGFFLMYEEAHIDKHCHNNDMTATFYALMRFNQVIGVVMEYAFYHPETFVLITADHETGGLTPNSQGSYSYTQDSHSGANVPVFAYGMSTEVFDGETIENTQIPKTIAYLMGKKNFGANDQYKSLLP